MDLRCHGDSPTVSSGNTMESVAKDVFRTLQEDNISISTVVGHSFGGKVALEMMRHQSSLQTAIILDISLSFYLKLPSFEIDNW